MKNKYIVYCITNRKNGKRYIGQTKSSLEDRWKRHCSSSRNGSKLRFHAAIKKYGIYEWDKEILGEFERYEDVCKNEEHLIKEFKTMDFDKGYNATTGGTGGWMLDRCSDEEYATWLQKQRKRATGTGNNNYSEISDQELIEIGVNFVKKYGFIGGRNRLYKFDNRMLKHFTKFRFGGKWINYYKEVEKITGIKYNPYYRDLSQRESAKQTIKFAQEKNTKYAKNKKT